MVDGADALAVKGRCRRGDARRRWQGVFGFAVAVGLVSSTLAGCGDPQIVVPQVLSVVTILPSQGSTEIAPTVEGLIYFSHPLASPETLSDHVSLKCLGTPPCSQPDASSCAAQPPQVTLSYDSTSYVVHVVPQAPLAATTCYQYVVTAGLTSSDKNVAPLPGEVDSSFQTR